MNIYGSIIRMGVVLILLIGNTVSFGMVTIANLPKPQYKKNSSPEFKAKQAVGFKRFQRKLAIDNTNKVKIAETDRLFNASIKLSELSDSDEKGIEYQKEIRSYVDILQEKRLALLLSLPKEDAISCIHGQFQRMREDIASNEEDARNELKKAYDVDTEEWNHAMVCADMMYNAIFLIANTKTNAFHDPQLCYEWLLSLENAMQHNGFNMGAFRLTCENESVDHFASCKLDIDVDSASIVSAGIINFSKRINSYYKFSFVNHCSQEKLNGKSHLQSAAFHEITHAVKGHLIFEGLIVRLIKKSIATDLDGMDLVNKLLENKNSSFYRYHQATERTADVLTALHNPYAASCGRKVGSSVKGVTLGSYLKAHVALYPGSYAYLATADTNWKALKIINADENIKKRQEDQQCIIF